MQRKLRADYGSMYVTFGGGILARIQKSGLAHLFAAASDIHFGHIYDQFWQIDYAQA